MENKKKDKKKIYEEEVSIEELSSEISNQNESPRKDKNQVKTDLETAKQEEKLKKLEISKNEPITTSEEPSISTDMPKVDTELETANKTVEDLTKLIEPAPNTKSGDVNVDIVEKEEKFEPEISETSTDFFPINEIHLNSTHLVKKPEQEIDIIPHIFMTEEPPTTTTTMPSIKLEHTTTIPITETSNIGKPEIITKSTISLPSTTTTSLPSTSSSQPPLPPVHIHQNELGKSGFGKIGGDETENKETEIENPKPDMTWWDKYLIGLRCSMRDCKDALLPTEPFPRELSAPTVMRRIRGHESTICACGSTHMNQAGNS
uniref:Uncharacterized protein n=1 Tax=Acrobeloides nanus TaxID=290746 RepID=A0A914DMZ8_9BILA